MVAGFFLAGWIIRNVVPIQTDRFLYGVDFSGISEGSLFWVVLVVTSALTAYWFTYHEALSRLSSILIGYLVLMPFMAAGQSATANFTANSLPLIMVGLTRLGLALLVMFLTTWVLGFPPRKSLGTFVAVLIFALATVSLIDIIQRGQVPIQAQASEPTLVVVQTATPVPPTPTTLPPTATPTSVPTPHSGTHSEPGTDCNRPYVHFSACDSPKRFGHPRRSVHFKLYPDVCKLR